MIRADQESSDRSCNDCTDGSNYVTAGKNYDNDKDDDVNGGNYGGEDNGDEDDGDCCHFEKSRPVCRPLPQATTPF